MLVDGIEDVVILYNHVIEYIHEGHLDWIRKSLAHLSEDGKLLLFSPLRGGINAIYEKNMEELFGYKPFYSDNIEGILTQAGIPFSRERIRGECAISLLDEIESDEDAIRLLSFLTQIDCRELPNKTKATQAAYFPNLARPGGKHIPHPTDFYVLNA